MPWGFLDIRLSFRKQLSKKEETIVFVCWQKILNCLKVYSSLSSLEPGAGKRKLLFVTWKANKTGTSQVGAIPKAQKAQTVQIFSISFFMKNLQKTCSKKVDQLGFFYSHSVAKSQKNWKGTFWCNLNIIEKVSECQKIWLKNTKISKAGSLVCFRRPGRRFCSGRGSDLSSIFWRTSFIF